MKLLQDYSKSKIILSLIGPAFLLASIALLLLFALTNPSSAELAGYISLLIGSLSILLAIISTLLSGIFYFLARKSNRPRSLYFVSFCVNIIFLGYMSIHYVLPLLPSSPLMQAQKICGQRAEEHYQKIELPLQEKALEAYQTARGIDDELRSLPESPTKGLRIQAARDARDAIYAQLNAAREEKQKIYHDCRDEYDSRK